MDADLQSTVLYYLAEPGPARREAVVRAAVPLVRSILGKLTLPDHPLATRDDLEGAGLLGLLQALDSYDPARGALFVTHAYHRVRGALLDYLRSIDVVSADRRQKIGEAQRAADTLAQLLGEEPSDQDVADYLGLPLDEYHRLLTEAQARFALSDGHAPSGSEGDEGSVLDRVADPDAQIAFETVDDASTLDLLRGLIGALPERERTILALHYYEGLTLRQIGEVLGVSDARVSQIMGRTLLKLQKTLRGSPAAP